jgi:hypothetical protein
VTIERQDAEVLAREDIQRACRPQFWTLPAGELTLDGRMELISRVTDYLWFVGDVSWLNEHELEALMRLHTLLLDWLGE